MPLGQGYVDTKLQIQDRSETQEYQVLEEKLKVLSRK